MKDTLVYIAAMSSVTVVTCCWMFAKDLKPIQPSYKASSSGWDAYKTNLTIYATNLPGWAVPEPVTTNWTPSTITKVELGFRSDGLVVWRKLK